MQSDCQDCLKKQAKKLLVKYGIHNGRAAVMMEDFYAYLERNGGDCFTAPEAARYLNHLLQQEADTGDLYSEEKEHFNTLMLSLEEGVRQVIQASEDPFQTALRFALAGNIIDFAPSHSFDAYHELSVAASKKPAIDHSEALQKDLVEAETVLYLGDNAGEIVLDKLFIETIGHPNLYFATRGGNVLNDVTLEDAKKVGMDDVATVISNGYDVPSTLLQHCSAEFLEIFNKADVIISKGQGNLEGLHDYAGKKIFFLFMVKCHVIAEMIGVPENSSVVVRRM